MARLKLTPMARAVARYMLGGWNKESIASQMGITHATVNAYCEQIRIATGKRSVTAAILWILRDPEALSYVMDK